MPNSKISALTSATTPLAGTETLPVVQSSTTKQVAVSDLTAGRSVSVGSLTATTGTININYASPELTFTPTGAGRESDIKFVQTSGTYYFGIERSTGGSFGATAYAMISYAPAGYVIQNLIGGTGIITTVDANGLKLNAGNLIQGTAAKGINFTANTPAAGMTSQLLNWYEEGTWTPNQGAGLTLVGAFSSTGKYTRVGRNVTVSGTVTGATSVAVTAAGVVTSNLPFTVGTAGHGNITNAALTSFAAIICTSTNVTSAGAIAATGTLTFSATYFV